MHDKNKSFSKPVKLGSDERWYDINFASLGEHGRTTKRRQCQLLHKIKIMYPRICLSRKVFVSQKACEAHRSKDGIYLSLMGSRVQCRSCVCRQNSGRVMNHRNLPKRGASIFTSRYRSSHRKSMVFILSRRW